MKVQQYVMVVKAKRITDAKQRLLDSIPELEKRGAFHSRWGVRWINGKPWSTVTVYNSRSNVVATGLVRQGSRTRFLDNEEAIWNH